MRVTRRGFFGAVGAAAAAAALVEGQLAKADQGVQRLERWTKPEESVVPSICQQCPGGCGLMVRTLDGQVGGIAGNPLHPINRGAVCPKAFGALQLVYDPDRLKGPMARDGERGHLRPIGWDEALGRVRTRLSELRTKGLAHTLTILGGQYRGYRQTLWDRFAAAWGTPNYIRLRCLQPERPALAHQFMQGVTTPLCYDLSEANCILSFGASLLEAWQGPVHASLAFARLRGVSDRPRGRLIQVDPRRSQTAAKADRWVPIIPGTDGILALGIANALIREGLYDREFLDTHTLGAEEWVGPNGERHEGFKNLVLRDYGLVAVSAATGVPVNTILEVARELATFKPAIVIGERGSAYGRGDLQTRMAIHSLNALIGSIGVRGGLLTQAPLPLSPMPPLELDDVAKRALEQPRIDGAGERSYFLVSDAPQALPERIFNGTPYPINALFLFATNPLATHPAKEAFAQAFERIPFIVSFSPFLDETSARADLILPDHTYLERWQDDQVTHLAGFSCFSVARPAMSPRHQTRNTADVLLELAPAFGLGRSLPWKSYDRLLYEGARGLYEAQRGYVVSPYAEESLRKVLERQGYWAPQFTSYDEFWDALLKRGAWWDVTGLPVSRRALLKTPSGKFEFFPTRLVQLLDEVRRKHGSAALRSFTRGNSDRESFYPLPDGGAAARESGGFPFRLNTYRLATRPLGGGRNQPWLLEQPAVHVRASWERWVEIHPRAGADLGIADGDRVWVESSKGRIKLKVKFYSGTLPSVVLIPLFGGEGGNPNDLIANETDSFRGFGLLNTTKVKVYKA